MDTTKDDTNPVNVTTEKASWTNRADRAWAIPLLLLGILLLPQALIARDTTALSVVAIPILGLAWKVWSKKEGSPRFFSEMGSALIALWIVVNVLICLAIAGFLGELASA